MQEITTKVAKVRPVAAAIGMDEQRIRHLIHGTGGSPRRAKRAIKAGIAPILAETYQAALEDEGSHGKAVAKCNAMWADLMPSAKADADADEAEAVAH